MKRGDKFRFSIFCEAQKGFFVKIMTTMTGTMIRNLDGKNGQNLRSFGKQNHKVFQIYSYFNDNCIKL